MGTDIKNIGMQLIRFSGKRDIRRPSPIINAGATMIHGVAPNIKNLDLALSALESDGAPASLVEMVTDLKSQVLAILNTRDRR